MAREAVYFGDGNVPYKRWTMNTAQALEGSAYTTTTETILASLGVNDADPNAGGTPRYLNKTGRSRLDFLAVARATDSNSTDTMTVRVRLGTATGLVCAVSPVPDAADDDIFVLKGSILLETTGAAATVINIGDGQDTSLTGDGVTAGMPIWTATYQSATVYTTGALDLVVTVDWSVDHNDNDSSCDWFEATLWPAFGTADES